MAINEHYAGNRFVPASSEAKDFIDVLASKLTSSPRKAFKLALGALVADLFKAAAIDEERYCYRPVHNSAFADEPVGARGYNEALKFLEEKGYLDRLACIADPSRGIMKTTRFRAQRALLEWAEAHGVSVADFGAHFETAPRPYGVKRPLKAKAALRRDATWTKLPAKTVKVDFSAPKALQLAAQVNEINAFMASQVIKPDWHYAFHRIFNEADHPDFNWDRGGRLYSIGGGYQLENSRKRASITLNGEPTVEIDIKACFPTILHALTGVEFDPCSAYSVPGVHREAVKLWCVSTLSKQGYTKNWSQQNKADFEKKTGLALGKVQSAKGLIAPVCDHLPLLKNWPASKIRWPQLQYHESAAVIDCVHELAMIHQVPALPVFDSIIVPKEHEELAKHVLTECFERCVGVSPIVETKVP